MLKQILGIGLAILLGIGSAWYAVKWYSSQPLDKQQAQALPAGGDFSLHAPDKTLSLHDLKGKVVVLYFGYTACPDICPTSMATLKGGLNALKPEELAQVQGIFVSVDPERDTPQKVHEYAQYFHPSILGLTDTPDVLASVAKQYNVFYRKVPMPNSAMGYTLDHSSWLYIIDKNGQLREQVQHIFAPQDLANVIRKYL